MQKHKGFTHIIKATGYSIKGYRQAITETAFQHELMMAAVLIPLAFFLGDNGVEWTLMIGSVLIVLLVELLNSAIEAVVDRVGTEYHELSGRAKDLGSAAVTTALLIMTLIWLLLIVF
ncbi:diacylglycerol kinase [Chelonobacter oris]|uniref:Diacylglycerol kinase n=1 Tax=Chelonobacter oris TaxID=505317 RepID=A0A0A3BAG6_9PAST|nr:diacylglycerol kinase [Chelonobacter oris]KGQ70554.1 diacylglycerol kinase [Chelonobacter oris]